MYDHKASFYVNKLQYDCCTAEKIKNIFKKSIKTIVPYGILVLYRIIKNRTRMKLELSFADRIIQKDVNNYILIKNNKIIKGIGAFVSKASQFKSLRQSLVIVSDAVVNFLAFKISPCETIKNCNNMLKFKIISKAGKSYDKVTWEKTTRSLKLIV